jgi:hypothetical protein
MIHPRFRQLGIAITLAAALALAGAQPGEARGTSHGQTRLAPPQPGLFARAWDWLLREVPGARGLSGIWAEEGASLDPSGARGAGATSTPQAPVQPTTDMGPGLDPNGHQ